MVGENLEPMVGESLTPSPNSWENPKLTLEQAALVGKTGSCKNTILELSWQKDSLNE